MGEDADEWMDRHVFGLTANKADGRRVQKTPEQRKAKRQRERERKRRRRETLRPPSTPARPTDD